MTTETTNIGSGSGAGPSPTDAFGSSNWEERLAAAREKRQQVLEERRKSGDVVGDKPAIVGPKPWEVDDQNGAGELSFVEEFEPDEFDYEDSAPPEDLETSVLPLSAAVATAERDAEADPEEEEEESGHLRAVAFICGISALGLAVAFGAGMFVAKTDLPPDFLSGSSLVGGGIQEARVDVDAATPTRPVQPELTGTDVQTASTIAEQTTIDSLASDVSDDIVAVAVETTRAVNGDAAADVPIMLSTGQISRPVLVTGNSDQPLAMSEPANVSMSQVLADLPSLALPEPLAFDAPLSTDSGVQMAGLTSLSSPDQSDEQLDFSLNTQLETDFLPTAPVLASPETGALTLGETSALTDSATGWTAQGDLTSAQLNAAEPGITASTELRPETFNDLSAMAAPSESTYSDLPAAIAGTTQPQTETPQMAAIDAARADDALSSLPAVSSKPEGVILSVAVNTPAISSGGTTIPGIDPVVKAQPSLISLPNIIATEPPASLLPPEPQVMPAVDLARYVIRMHVPSAVPEDQFTARADALRDSGLKLDTARVDFKISTDQIRYFHAGDVQVASAIADEMGATLRDFTDFSPQPPAGTVEIWLSGNSAKPAAPARVTKRRVTTTKRTTTKRRVDPAAALRNQLARRLRRGDHL